MENDSKITQALERFTQMMIDLLEQRKDGENKWKPAFLSEANMVGMPQNFNGRPYSGGNAFFLQLYASMQGYKTPVFMTFNKVKDQGASVMKGQEAIPVIFYTPQFIDKDNKKVPDSVLATMTKEEKKELSVIPLMRVYPVFNIDQTTFKDVHPEKYEQIVRKFEPKTVTEKDTEGMYVNKALDRMFKENEWVCPVISDNNLHSPYYSPSKDEIRIPEKYQYALHQENERNIDGQSYYVDALHEMAHSTGSKERLNRDMKGHFGDPSYAKEELVAEMTAASLGHAMGFHKSVTESNADYLAGWLKGLKESPNFIKTVMSDVGKASNMIAKEIDSQYLKLGMNPVFSQSEEQKQKEKAEDEARGNILPDGRKIDSISIFKPKAKPGEKKTSLKVKASVDGVEQRAVNISKEDASAYRKGELTKTDIIIRYFPKVLDKVKTELQEQKHKTNSFKR